MTLPQFLVLAAFALAILWECFVAFGVALCVRDNEVTASQAANGLGGVVKRILVLLLVCAVLTRCVA